MARSKLRPEINITPLVDVVRVVASALTPSAGPIEWQVVAALGISWGRDLTTAMDVVVAR